MTRWIRHGVALCLAVALAACGGGGGGSDNSGGGPPPADQVTSITFGPLFLAVAPGQDLHIIATAHYADGRSEIVTSLATWESSNNAVVTLSTVVRGIVTGVAVGEADVMVRYAGFSAVAHVQVGSILEAIDVVVPGRLAIGIGATHQFNALGQFTDGAFDVTKVAQWTSSDATVARLDATGVATGLAPGKVTVTVTSQGIHTSVDLEVLPIQTLFESDSDSIGLQFGGLGLSSSGMALSTWSHRFAQAGAPDIFYSTGTASTGWTQAASLRIVPEVELASAPQIVMNDAGSAVAAWQQKDGLYAASYSPTTGWRPLKKVDSEGEQDLSAKPGIGIDAAGNALLTWKISGTGIGSSRLDATTDQWSTPTLVPLSNGASSVVFQTRLVMSPTGDAMMAWTRATFAPQPTYELLVSIWAPGTAPGTGWQAPESIRASGDLSEFAVATDDARNFAVAWLAMGNTASATAAVRRFNAVGGWSPTETVASGLTRNPHEPMLAFNTHGAAVLAWRHAFDMSVSAALFDGAGAWGNPVDLYRPNPDAAGDPRMLKPRVTEDGRVLVAFLASDLSLLGQVVTARYLPSTGWEQFQSLTYTARGGTVVDVDIEFDRQGRGAIAWAERAGGGSKVYAKEGLSF